MMMNTLKVASLMLAAVMGEVNHNNVNSKYFIGSFNAGEFPLAVDKCQPNLIIPQGGFQMATCEEENLIKHETFSSSSCSGSATSTTYYNVSTGDYGLYDFNCDDDRTDSYAEIYFGVGACDTDSKVTIYAALEVCTLTTTDDLISINVYCKGDDAELQYYNSEGLTEATCTTATIFQTATSNETCGYMLTSGDNDVYGETVSCTVAGDSVDDDDDSASQLFVMGTLLFAGIAALLQ